MTLNLPLLYVLWLEEYCQISPNKSKSPNFWHITSILVCCIFAPLPPRFLDLPLPLVAKRRKQSFVRCQKLLFYSSIQWKKMHRGILAKALKFSRYKFIALWLPDKTKGSLMSKSCHKLDYPTFAECKI